MIEILNIKVVTDDDIDSLDRQMILIAELINGQFPQLTIPEVKEAFKLYVAKKFIDVKVFRLIDCVAVGEILTAYIDHRNQSVEPFLIKRQTLLNAPIEKTESEKEKIFSDFVKMVYDEVLKNKFSDTAWYLFKKLEESGTIIKTNEEKQELYEKELRIYIDDEKQRITKQNPLNKKFVLKELEKSHENGKRPTYVKNRCRSILVSKYILNSKISIEELLTILKS